MTNNQRFDEHIKEQLGGYSPDVPSHIWENIMAKKEKRKPAGFWANILNNRNLLVMLALFMAGGSGAWLLIKNSTGHANDKSEIPATKKSSTTNTTVALNETPKTTTAENNVSTSGTPNLSSDNNTTITLPSLTTTKTDPATLSRVRSPFFEHDIQEGPVAFNKRTGKTKSSINVKTTDGSLTEDETVVNDALPPGGTLINRLIYGAEKMAAKKSSADLFNPFPPFEFLPDCPNPEKNASGNKKYFEFYAGPDYALRSLKDTGNSAYLQKRKESSTFTSAYSAGIRYTRVFSNSISVRAGINYSQINEKFTYKQGNLVQVTYIIDVNGDTTGSYITTGTRVKTTHNKYRSIDIPLTVGYEIGNGRLHANFNAGAVINVYSWQKGEVLDTAYLPVNITTGKGSSPYQFKTNAGIGFIGAVSVYYKLTDKLHVMAEPYYRHNFSQMNKENLTVKQKYNTIGIRVGVRVDLH